jgi:hypothetical protein
VLWMKDTDEEYPEVPSEKNNYFYVEWKQNRF